MGHRSLTTVVFLLVLLQLTTGLNILGIFPYQGKSHFFVFRAFLQELSRRGHNLTVISHFPEINPPENYKDISLAGSIKNIEDEVIPFEKSYGTELLMDFMLIVGAIENCKVMLMNKEVQDMIQQKPKFDVIIVEQFNSDCALGLAYKLKAPVIGLTSHLLLPHHYHRLGIPNNPFHFWDGEGKATLYQRLKRVIIDFHFTTVFYFVGQKTDQTTFAEYFDDIPPLEDLAREIKFHLLYHNFVLTGSRLFPSNVIEVGGYHVGELKPLTGDLKTFIDEAENGVIYISFGSVVKSSAMPADKVQAVLGAMQELPQRFIWKWEDKTLIVDKNKLFTSNWLPQVDILGHPKTLAFISHAGIGGTTEAIHYGVPMVAMPVMADQPANAAAVEESGLGVILPFRDLTKETLLNALKQVLDPGFRARVKQVSSAWHDRPMSPLDTAVYWTEFAARHPNFTFRAASVDVPFYQNNNLDIAVGFIAVLLFLTLMLVIGVVRICCEIQRTLSLEKSKFKHT